VKCSARGKSLPPRSFDYGFPSAVLVHSSDHLLIAIASLTKAKAEESLVIYSPNGSAVVVISEKSIEEEDRIFAAHVVHQRTCCFALSYTH
jgi:hypothetical protein